MPTKSIFRQPGARHFQVVHRSQRDPLINDPDASQHVLKPIRRGKTRADLERSLAPEELSRDLSRANIGEAADYGIYYDDTDYDYMQHLRPVGLLEDGVDSILVEGPSVTAIKAKRKGKGKGKGKEEDSLHDMFRDLPSEALPSTSELPRDYGAQNAVPAGLAGLQPDMDPHLRQAIEALEDDAFVDDGLDDDFFAELVGEGERDVEDEPGFEFDEDGGQPEEATESEDAEDEGAENWEKQFAKFKKEHQLKTTNQLPGSDVDSDARSEGGDTVGQLPAISVIGGKRRRKGSSDASGYSMSSSSMFRNKGLTLLDEQFEQIEKEYNSDHEDEEESSDNDNDGAPPLITSREDFNSIMDDFLNNYEILGGKMRHVLPGETVTDKLGTIRQSLREIGYGAQEHVGDEDDESDSHIEKVQDKSDRWDCETILSTYSNLENHPRLIRVRETNRVPKIHLDKTGLPSVNTSKGKCLTASPPSNVVLESIRTTIARSKSETKEEKRTRKQAVKEERQTRRVEKKITKEQFSNEKKHQLQVLANIPKGIKKL